MKTRVPSFTSIIVFAAFISILVFSGCSSPQPQQVAHLQQQYPDTYARTQQEVPLSVADIKALNKSGIRDDNIISKIRDSHTIFHLSANDIIDLHNSGVSQKVIDFMINTQSSLSAATPPDAPMAPPPPPAVAQATPPTPGPNYVWVNGEWVWNNGWYWSGGYWLLPPFRGGAWVGGYWERGPHGWVHYGGHWRR